jgi:hypothetical protein
MISIVAVQSPPGEKFVMLAVPVFDKALNIIALCETDLSPGAIISPRRDRGRAIVTGIRILLLHPTTIVFRRVFFLVWSAPHYFGNTAAKEQPHHAFA